MSAPGEESRIPPVPSLSGVGAHSLGDEARRKNARIDARFFVSGQ
jgi:hypothetical protein